MLRPFLLVGVGGSGGKTLRAVRDSLDLMLKAQGWDKGIPQAWQFLHFDTPTTQDGAEFPAKFLPFESYKGLVASSATYENVMYGIKSKVKKELAREIEIQLPDPSRVAVSIVAGAGQYRAVGRAIALAKLDEIASAAEQAILRMRKPDVVSELQELGKKLKSETKQGSTDIPVIVFVSSIAGGSGAGQYLDVVEAVKAKFASEEWSKETYGILYAPDVFDGISGGSGIASNALATVLETTNGHWNNTPDLATIELLRARGLEMPTGGANDRIGVRYPFVVGRQGATTSFGGQLDVYKAISTTICAWMTDDLFQDSIQAYTKTNFTKNVDRASLPENTGLAQDGFHVPPLSAIGFGRVTMAHEKFMSYSTERFARSIIERLLNAHKEGHRVEEGADESLWIRESAAKALIPFIENSGLNEDTAEHDQVIDALRATAELANLKMELKQQVLNTSSAALDKNGGLSPDTWSSRLVSARQDLIKGYLERDRKNRQQNLTNWVNETPEKLLKLVATYAVSHGLPVVAELLGHLQLSIGRAAVQLKAEALTFEAAATNLQSYVYDAIRAAGSATSITAESDAVQAALNHVSESLYWESENELRKCASSVLEEVGRDLVGLLKSHVESLYKALEVNSRAQETADGRNNDFAFWPKIDSVEVAKKYFPAPNEKMLLEPEEFPAKFNELVKATFIEQSTELDAAMAAVREMVTELEGLPLIGLARTWKPTTQADPNTIAAAPETPAFNSYSYPEDYLVRADKWIQRPGKAFKGHFNQDLVSYLDKKALGPAEFNERKDRFLGHLRAAFKSASPLVKLHAGLLNQVHGKSIGDGDSTIVSAIPFNTQSEMYEVTKQALIGEMQSRKYPDGTTPEGIVNSWFRESPVHSIEFFTMLGYPVMPIVLQSVMEPVARDWNKKNGNQESRSAFKRWTRARLLGESVPMDQKALTLSIKGWYVAQALSLIEVTPDQDLGPKLSVKNKDATASMVFPHPLYYTGNLYAHDYLAAVLESLGIALASCTSQGNLNPLLPYQRLIALGGNGQELAPEPSTWLMTGKKPGQAAGSEASSEADVRQRIEKVQSYFNDQVKKFRDLVEKHASSEPVYDYPVAWEIKDEIELALKDLIKQVGEYKFAGGAVELDEGL